ncbi:MAG: UDP-N-acetylmuramoylalanyl-D-glutamyl-2,6-diaminopimelate--D-alanyl-D-alanine ligase [Mesorhizobium sp.]|nr:UDP-N-acetylmuramoylalanyl-D-glutamyl-2,6-diaminopimelate--D-alanyl-D-alanine ligase [Mesorhizobium sp.]MCO5163159.1 UDP-N-acetylmuramoylalanyl-D-glutamyl-2,6-diaminopimelate--D-alanyl-D-alanine ligase [Mesorhizobium sp.]
MSLLWTARTMIESMGGRPIGTLPAGITGISIDSRTLKPGEAFFAIKGDVHDGHDFVTSAIKAGAVLLVVAESRLAGLGRITTPMIVVDDVLAALVKLAAAARARAKGKIIAVTGSAGKTTTKEALRHVLSAVGSVHASEKSFNNHWGVPLTLARLPGETDFAVFEIGMNHPDEIRPLVKLVRPHIAIITLIAAAHLGHFRKIEEIARAKAEIFEGIEPGGYALVNRDDAQVKLLEKLAKAAGVSHIVSFGEHERAHVRLLACELGGDHSEIAVGIGGEQITARVGAPGRHMVQNALAVIGAAKLAGADLGKVAAALGHLQAEAGRGRRHHLGGGIMLIDESYNANPASMKAAIDLLERTEPPPGGRRIAVLGDMLELGAHAERLHAGLADLIAPTKTDLVYLGGPEMAALAARLPPERLGACAANVDELKPIVLAALRPGDVVVVKSSKGIGFSKLVDALIKNFPVEGESQRRA